MSQTLFRLKPSKCILLCILAVWTGRSMLLLLGFKSRHLSKLKRRKPYLIFRKITDSQTQAYSHKELLAILTIHLLPFTRHSCCALQPVKRWSIRLASVTCCMLQPVKPIHTQLRLEIRTGTLHACRARAIRGSSRTPTGGPGGYVGVSPHPAPCSQKACCARMGAPGAAQKGLAKRLWR